MFADLEQQLWAGALLEVGKASTDQLEWRALHLRQVESKREFALKPRFNRMPVGRYYVNWISAGDFQAKLRPREKKRRPTA